MSGNCGIVDQGCGRGVCRNVCSGYKVTVVTVKIKNFKILLREIVWDF